jgi:hypothetical protein
MHQQDVDHGGLVDDQQIAFEPVVGIPFEAAAFRVNLQQPVDGLGLEPGGFGHALGGTPVGAHSNRLTPLAARMRKIELTMVVLPTPGPPVMTSTFDKRANRIAAT